MISRAARRHIEEAARAGMRAELAPVLVRLDGILAALEVHIQNPAVVVDYGAPEGDRTVLLQQLRDTLGHVTESFVKVVEQPVRPVLSPPPRRRAAPALQPPADIAVAPEPEPGETPAATSSAPVEPEPPAQNTEELMREWLAQDLRRNRLSEDEIERRLAAAQTKHLFAAANARRVKLGLPPFEVPA